LRPNATNSPRIARFGSFELDMHAGELRHNGGEPVALSEQPFRILVMLLENPQSLVTREDIRTALWPNGTSVEFDHSISAAMNRLRRALGDNAEDPRFIDTIARRGYRWKTSVEWIEQPRIHTNGDQAIAVPSPPTPQHSGVKNRTPMMVGIAAILVVAVLTPWLLKTTSTAGSPSRQPIYGALTSNSFENRVTSGQISPDGTYLAYADTKHVYLKIVKTGETREVSQPQEFKGKNIGWQCVSWLPDSAHFIVNAHESGIDSSAWSSQESSIWIASLVGESPRKIRDSAVGYSVSPDGSLIGFGTSKGKLGDREIWLMRPDGSQPRKFIATNDDSALANLIWSPDGRRVIYSRTDPSAVSLWSRSIDTAGSMPARVRIDTASAHDFFWMNDGRLLFSREESITGQCNSWAVRLDSRTGEPTDEPSRLANWPKSCLDAVSETRDGKLLTFVKSEAKLSSFLADLSSRGNRLLNVRHFPRSEVSDAVVDWATDSNTFFAISNRTGKFGIYKQRLDQDVDEPIVTEGYGRNPFVVPGGQSIVYLGIGKNGPWPNRGPEPVMRVSTDGGVSRELFVAAPYSLLTCPESGACVIGEPTEDGRQLIVTNFDAEKGRGAELFRFDLVAGDESWWLDISPDGRRAAILRTETSPLDILSLDGHVLREVQIKGVGNVTSVHWAADGNGFFIGTGSHNAKKVFHLDLQGYAEMLWVNQGSCCEILALPSPDGHRLFIQTWTRDGNIATLENF